jgi:hypothetical protein
MRQQRTSALRSWLAWAALLALAGGAPCTAQERGRKEKEPQAVDLPVEALKFGDAALGQATPGFLKWAKAYAEKEMHEQHIAPKAAMALVDQRYKGTSDAARDCGIFLLFHLAYKDEDMRVTLLESEIREIDRETYDITRELQLMFEAEQNRAGSVRGPLTAGERIVQQEMIDKKNARLRDLREKKIELGRKVQEARRKVNYYLKVAAVTHERMRGINPAAIQELK